MGDVCAHPVRGQSGDGVALYHARPEPDAAAVRPAGGTRAGSAQRAGPARRSPANGGLPRPALIGVLPLVSHRHAEFLHNELPGFAVPAWVRDRMRLAPDGRQEGIGVAHELMEAVRSRVGGVYLIPSFGRYDGVLELVRLARQPAKT